MSERLSEERMREREAYLLTATILQLQNEVLEAHAEVRRLLSIIRRARGLCSGMDTPGDRRQILLVLQEAEDEA